MYTLIMSNVQDCVLLPRSFQKDISVQFIMPDITKKAITSADIETNILLDAQTIAKLLLWQEIVQQF